MAEKTPAEGRAEDQGTGGQRAPAAVRIRPCPDADVEAMLAIERRAYGFVTPVDEAMFRSVIRLDPEGAIGAEADGVLVGFLLCFQARRRAAAAPRPVRRPVLTLRASAMPRRLTGDRRCLGQPAASRAAARSRPARAAVSW